jgi:energy-coupling factor transport system ATP-binding protein
MKGTAPIIELENLDFAYPDGTRALRSVSLRIEPGSTVAIVGENGSGKSTLLRHLNGLLRPSGGRVLIDGDDIHRVPVEKLAAQIGFAFQDPDLQIFEERVRDEVAFGPRNLGVTGLKLQTAIAEALHTVGLDDAHDANPFVLGYSRRKLVALASVLAMRTPVLVLDEPTTGQDGAGMRRVGEIVADAAAAKRTVIASSHAMGFVAENFERIVVLREGAIIADGPPEIVFAPEAWPLLHSTHLEPPPAARVGAAFGLGSTPTEAAFVRALTEQTASAEMSREPAR